tara:strand:+ start:102 stop:311 length:210 start_codon:yes stop_codon:yes gene_type:complete
VYFAYFLAFKINASLRLLDQAKNILGYTLATGYKKLDNLAGSWGDACIWSATTNQIAVNAWRMSGKDAY